MSGGSCCRRLMLGVMALDYGLNFSQAVFFRRAGFLASIIARLAFYVVWHVLYVH